jgi:hypothetical protein
MRIGYVAYWDLAADDGVARKIGMQIRLWREAGHHVETFTLRPSALRTRAAGSRALVRAVRRAHPDVLYLRHDLFLPSVWRLIREYATVVERNEDDLAELRLRSRAAFAYGVVNRAAIFSGARGVVAVTHALRVATRPSMVIGNGMNPADVPWLPPPANSRPVAAFLGSPGLPWHGVDRLLGLALHLPELDVELIGPSAADVRGAPANVHAHGRLPQAAYLPILARADLAFGSLAMHRAGLSEGSPLKVREYLLAGIPTVIGYDDTDFGNAPPWYLLRLPDASRPAADAAAVASFLAEVRGRRVPRDEAEERVGAPAKERARLEFISHICSAT